MHRLNFLCCGSVSFVVVMSVLNAWCADATDPAILEVERLKKVAVAEEKWNSSGPVTRQELLGYYKYWPFDWDAFWLKADGTGLLYGGARGLGDWRIMWEYDEKSATLVIQSVQVKRQYKVIKKDGKAWMIEGREVWRQGANHNAPIPFPRDKAQRVDSNPPKKLQRIR